MTPNAAPARLDVVLIGGGHAHVQVLRSFGMYPEPGVRLTLIAKELEAPYSGMLPGLIAGHYTHEECHINLVRLARFANARLIHGSVTGIDRATKRIAIDGRPPLAYDLASIDVGIAPDVSGIEGAAEHALAVKPISALTPKWQALEAAAQETDGPRRFVVVGGGAAGFELVHALRHRFRDLSGKAQFTLVAGDKFLKSVNAVARNHARQSLASTGGGGGRSNRGRSGDKDIEARRHTGERQGLAGRCSADLDGGQGCTVAQGVRPSDRR